MGSLRADGERFAWDASMAGAPASAGVFQDVGSTRQVWSSVAGGEHAPDGSELTGQRGAEWDACPGGIA